MHTTVKQSCHLGWTHSHPPRFPHCLTLHTVGLIDPKLWGHGRDPLYWQEPLPLASLRGAHNPTCPPPQVYVRGAARGGGRQAQTGATGHQLGRLHTRAEQVYQHVGYGHGAFTLQRNCSGRWAVQGNICERVARWPAPRVFARGFNPWGAGHATQRFDFITRELERGLLPWPAAPHVFAKGLNPRTGHVSHRLGFIKRELERGFISRPAAPHAFARGLNPRAGHVYQRLWFTRELHPWAGCLSGQLGS